MTDYDRAAFSTIFTARRVMAHGASLQVVEGGAGPLLLLVPGWPQSLHTWRKVMPALAERYRVVAFDPPGLGDSEPPVSGQYDTAHIASHIDPLLDDLGAKDCLLVTHDIGAWLGYAYAVRRPERVRKLVAIDAVIPGMAPPDVYTMTPERLHKTWHFAFNFLPELPELLITGREREFLAWLFKAKSIDVTKTIDTAALDEYARLYATPGRWSMGLGFYRAIFDSITQNRATANTPLPMPVLAVGGEAGLGAAMRGSFEKAAPNLTGAVIPACGHYVPEECPEALLAVMEPFLAG
ncbi:MAG: alpha/beta hydrolase [Pseudolabrys sp.]|nr:alpha/beta hydrolase [Pseudolabrys sp.]